METLIDSNWHGSSSSSTGGGGREEELAHWTGATFLLLLICTGITVKRSRLDRWMVKNSGRIRRGRFFCVLDETVTSDVWGQDFVALADAIKTKRFKPGDGEGQGGRGDSIGSRNAPESQLPNRSKKRPRNT